MSIRFSLPLMPTPALTILKHSPIQGSGVFARRTITPGQYVIEYTGERITWKKALRRAAAKGDPLSNHTFFFALGNGKIVDGGSNGNDARYINHSCEPNCAAVEYPGGRIFLYALHEIRRGEELSYSYPLEIDCRQTSAIKRAFACHCGAENCTGTMLAPKKRRSVK